MRKGDIFYYWLGVIILALFVATGAMPERVKAEPIIYPVKPFEGELIPSNTTQTNKLLDRAAKTILWESERSGREIYGTGRVGETPASDRGSLIGDAERADEGFVLAEETDADLGTDYDDPKEAYQPDLTYLGTWTATAYCGCHECCGSYSSGYTASGTHPTEGRTIACNALPMGTQVSINGNTYVVEDTGYTPYGDAWLDIYFNSHEAALAFGVQQVDVYVLN